ncbi:MAG: sigma-70 family RNA polymerase sigma factor [Clostridiales bacterium]|nr:sigma-70 family RNA polymerase sigma factor [Clostridiales bacterium]
MRRFQNTDYVRNKYSKGILYKVSDGYIEVTLEDYIKENPDKTEEDFMELKQISDAIYYEQDQEEASYARRKEEVEVEEIMDEEASLLDIRLIEQEEKEEMTKAVKQLLNNKDLTFIQRRRFYLHFFEGMSYREIAKQEGIYYTSVRDSIQLAIKKIKKYIN